MADAGAAMFEFTPMPGFGFKQPSIEDTISCSPSTSSYGPPPGALMQRSISSPETHQLGHQQMMWQGGNPSVPSGSTPLVSPVIHDPFASHFGTSSQGLSASVVDTSSLPANMQQPSTYYDPSVYDRFQGLSGPAHYATHGLGQPSSYQQPIQVQQQLQPLQHANYNHYSHPNMVAASYAPSSVPSSSLTFGGSSPSSPSLASDTGSGGAAYDTYFDQVISSFGGAATMRSSASVPQQGRTSASMTETMSNPVSHSHSRSNNQPFGYMPQQHQQQQPQQQHPMTMDAGKGHAGKTSPPSRRSMDDSYVTQGDSSSSSSAPMTGTQSQGAQGQKPKRRRADAMQLKTLYTVYERTAFPSTEERAELAAQLNMTPRQVQIWFQNQRQSYREKQRDEEQKRSGSQMAAASAHGNSNTNGKAAGSASADMTESYSYGSSSTGIGMGGMGMGGTGGISPPNADPYRIPSHMHGGAGVPHAYGHMNGHGQNGHQLESSYNRDIPAWVRASQEF